MGAASVERSERGAIAEFGAGGRGGKVGRPLADGERGGGHHPERAVLSAVVVVLAPVLIRTCAPARQENSSTERSSSRTRPPKLSTHVGSARRSACRRMPVHPRDLGRLPGRTCEGHQRSSPPEEEVIHRRHWNAQKDVTEALGRSTAQ